MPACLELEARVPRGVGRPGLPRRARRPAARLRRPAVAAHRVPAPVRASSACACCSSARTSTTPARTRSTTCSARPCSPERMGKHRLIAETGAGQHGVATATAAALFGLECVVYMGEVDMERQALNVFRMRLLGAEVRPVSLGQPHAEGRGQRGACATGWPPSRRRHYCLGSVMGPHPYPWMVREFHRVIGDEAREQCRALLGGGDPDVRRRLRRRRLERGRHLRGLRRHRRPSWSASSRPAARPSATACPASCTACSRILHAGRVRPGASRPQSISAGLDYPGVGPEHAPPRRHRPGPLRAGDRRRGARRLPAAGAHRGHHPGARAGARAGVGVRERAGELAGKTVLVNLSGRGDKDVAQVTDILGPTMARADAARRSSRAPARSRARRRAQAARAVRHRRARRRLDRRRARRRRRRRRRHRDRHPVLRPGHGRPDDPGGVGSGRCARGATPRGDPRRAARRRRRRAARGR